MLGTSWVVRKPSEPMQREQREMKPAAGEVLIQVAGCGICHTDLGFYYEGVPTRHPLPLTLGHEISGTVVEAGPDAGAWMERAVIVPAVMPCGTCIACRSGQGSICSRQVFPGNDVHGGFATHVVVPSRGLCAVPDPENLAMLSVVADAVSTPYQALLRGQVGRGDMAVFVGAGGVGGFGVQIAAAMGAVAVAIDVDAARLELMGSHGAALTLDASRASFKDLRGALRDLAARHEIPTWRQKIFETSGSPKGQSLAFGLLGHGGYLGVVGYSPEKAEVKISNLMALHATAQGNWGCLPEHYPAVVDLVLSGKVALGPFVELRPLSSINESFIDVRERRISRRLILVPES
jgi:6-hydroxycyclohex-1-ene-1-carbonyl-CoA dehydrogenase